MNTKKICFKCKIEKKLDCFYKHNQMADGHLNKCKDCTKKDTKEFSERPVKGFENYDRYRQRHSIKRMFNHRYNSLKNRCLVKRENHNYSSYGKKYLSRDEWYNWCYEENHLKKFMELYNIWVQSDFNSKLMPSIDRIDSNKGYIIGNLQWLSKSDNSKKYNK